MSEEPGLSGFSSSDGSGLEADPAKALMPPSLRAGTPVWTSPVTPGAAWLPLLQVLQVEEVGSQGGCNGLWTPLLPSGAAGNHPCALAAYCSASLCTSQVPSGMEPGSQGTSFPLEFLRAYGKWGRGDWMLQSFQRNSCRAENIKRQQSQPAQRSWPLKERLQYSHRRLQSFHERSRLFLTHKLLCHWDLVEKGKFSFLLSATAAGPDNSAL